VRILNSKLTILQFQGKWIGSNQIRMNQMRKEFQLARAVSSATLHISGIGYYELQINGYEPEKQEPKLSPKGNPSLETR